MDLGSRMAGKTCSDHRCIIRARRAFRHALRPPTAPGSLVGARRKEKLDSLVAELAFRRRGIRARRSPSTSPTKPPSRPVSTRSTHPSTRSSTMPGNRALLHGDSTPPLADFDAVMATNVRGVFAMAQEAGRRWRDARQPGNIVNIASILGQRVAGGVTPLCDLESRSENRQPMRSRSNGRVSASASTRWHPAISRPRSTRNSSPRRRVRR